MCVLIQQSACSCFQLPAALHQGCGAAHGAARRDGVEVSAFAMIALDQLLGFAVEVLGPK
jgi:hypothetical protein